MATYLRPLDLASALEALAGEALAGRPLTVICGAADYFPTPAASSRAVYLKLGQRSSGAASVAAVLEFAPDGTVGRLRLAVGACAEVARRLAPVEEALRGLPLDDRLSVRVTAAHLTPLTPLGDPPGSADFRHQAALVMVRRAIDQLVQAGAASRS